MMAQNKGRGFAASLDANLGLRLMVKKENGGKEGLLKKKEKSRTDRIFEWIQQKDTAETLS